MRGGGLRGRSRGGFGEVGVGIKAFRDPALAQDFDAPRLPIDVADFHAYAVDWDTDQAVFTVDGEVVRRCPRPPTYPMQLMVAVFDFPEWSVGGDDHLVPELVVDRIAGELTGRPRGVGATGQPLGDPCFWRGTGLSAWSRETGGHARPAAGQTADGPRSGGTVESRASTLRSPRSGLIHPEAAPKGK